MPVVFRRTVPIFRIFDVAKAREFYLDYLGFAVDWEDGSNGERPMYLQVSRGLLVLHLSEHHGDACPGSTAYVQVEGVRELHDELDAKEYRYLRPGLQEDELGTTLELTDPFGNRLRLNQPPAPPAAA